MKSHHMEMDEKWAGESGVGWGEWEKGGNWLAPPADVNGGYGGEEREGREG